MNQMTRCSHRCREKNLRAFTLVELLAVIAIIALLAALLFPALKHVMVGTNKAKCAGHLRAIGQYLSTYAADNDGQTVPTALANNYNWSEIVGNAPYADVYLGYLVPPSSIWRCPENKKQILDFESNWQGEIGCSYTINGFLPPYQAGYTFENRYSSNRMANFDHPSKTYAVFEGTYFRCQVGGGDYNMVRWPHGDSMNILCNYSGRLT